jgi:hypothetical protein
MVRSATCELKKTLTGRCDQTQTLYIQAADRLGRHPTGGFDEAYKAVGEARNAYDVAMEELKAHCKEHGC